MGWMSAPGAADQPPSEHAEAPGYSAPDEHGGWAGPGARCAVLMAGQRAGRLRAAGLHYLIQCLSGPAQERVELPVSALDHGDAGIVVAHE